MAVFWLQSVHERLVVELSICDIKSLLKKVHILEYFRLEVFLTRDNRCVLLNHQIYPLTLVTTLPNWDSALGRATLRYSCSNQLFRLALVTSLSSWDDVVVITPVVGCMVNNVGGDGDCSRMEYRSRVCIVSGSSLSVAQTSPTTEPAEEKLPLTFQILKCAVSLIHSFLPSSEPFWSTLLQTRITAFRS